MFTIIAIIGAIAYWREILISVCCFAVLIILIVILHHRRSKKRAEAYAAEMARRAAEIRFVGNKNTMVFHKADCYTLRGVPVGQRVGFKTCTEANACGFKACQVCRPWY